MNDQPPCPLCGHPSACLWGGPRATHECGGCGVVWVRPDGGRPAYVECGSDVYYEQHYLPRAEALTRDFGAQLEWLSEHVSGSRWLDVGCGAGYFAAAAVSRGWEVTGIDPSPAAIRLAREVAPEGCFFCGSAADLPNDEPYDVVSFWDSIMYVPDLPDELDRFLASLEHGGAVVVKTPHRPARVHRAARLLLGWRPALRDDLTHVRARRWHFTPESVAALLRRHGLDPVSWRWVREVPDPADARPASARAAARDVVRRMLDAIAGMRESFIVVARKPERAEWRSTGERQSISRAPVSGF